MEYPVELNEIPEFALWLPSFVEAGNDNFEDDIVDLAMPPNFKMRSFKSLKE